MWFAVLVCTFEWETIFLQSLSWACLTVSTNFFSDGLIGERTVHFWVPKLMLGMLELPVEATGSLFWSSRCSIPLVLPTFVEVRRAGSATFLVEDSPMSLGWRLWHDMSNLLGELSERNLILIFFSNISLETFKCLVQFPVGSFSPFNKYWKRVGASFVLLRCPDGTVFVLLLHGPSFPTRQLNWKILNSNWACFESSLAVCSVPATFANSWHPSYRGLNVTPNSIVFPVSSRKPSSGWGGCSMCSAWRRKSFSGVKASYSHIWIHALSRLISFFLSSSRCSMSISCIIARRNLRGAPSFPQLNLVLWTDNLQLLNKPVRNFQQCSSTDERYMHTIFERVKSSCT